MNKYKGPYRVAIIKDIQGLDARWGVVDSNGRFLLAYNLDRYTPEFVAARLNLSDELDKENASLKAEVERLKEQLADMEAEK
jgi:hypothetical protein